jgi:sulfatase maturation enzyme AslB (radical SAM superfamily)
MSRNIKVLHLEPTDVCQAACPLCARETDKTFHRHQQHHLSVRQVQRHFDDQAIANLTKMFMCGNYGDPVAGKHTVELYQYFRSVNPSIVLGLNTNGALQKQQWWKQLASVFNQPNDYVVFSIDGLEDTNHVYRKNVSWKKLIENAQAFIDAGGSAHWDMLVYQHNEHQVDLCKKLALDMGFTWFRAKVSKRPFINGLNPPATLKVSRQKNTNIISCHAEIEKSAYIDARGIVKPCCWLGDYDVKIQDLSEVAVTWNTDHPHAICKESCSVTDNNTVFKNQWRIEEQLC